MVVYTQFTETKANSQTIQSRGQTSMRNVVLLKEEVKKKNTNEKTFNNYHSSETNDRTLAHFIPFSP